MDTRAKSATPPDGQREVGCSWALPVRSKQVGLDPIIYGLGRRALRLDQRHYRPAPPGHVASKAREPKTHARYAQANTIDTKETLDTRVKVLHYDDRR
jgi:hypothetical protein